jgi:hypothetical protein
MIKCRYHWRRALAVSCVALVVAALGPAISRARAADPQSADRATVIRYLVGYGYVAPYEIAASASPQRWRPIRKYCCSMNHWARSTR